MIGKEILFQGGCSSSNSRTRTTRQVPHFFLLPTISKINSFTVAMTLVVGKRVHAMHSHIKYSREFQFFSPAHSGRWYFRPVWQNSISCWYCCIFGIIQGGFFGGTPQFQYQKENCQPANQSCSSCIVNPVTKKGRDMLHGRFSFWYWNWGAPVKKNALYN